jgi:hypothetical protein
MCFEVHRSFRVIGCRRPEIIVALPSVCPNISVAVPYFHDCFICLCVRTLDLMKTKATRTNLKAGPKQSRASWLHSSVGVNKNTAVSEVCCIRGRVLSTNDKYGRYNLALRKPVFGRRDAGRGRSQPGVSTASMILWARFDQMGFTSSVPSAASIAGSEIRRRIIMMGEEQSLESTWMRCTSRIISSVWTGAKTR